jgi:fluoroacetyl-CoA thioesterase
MREVPAGTKGTYTFTVAKEHLASRGVPTLPDVLATGQMISAMEIAAIEAVKAFLDPGETSVGISVNVKHLAPTPLGNVVRAEAEVVASEGRRLEFKVRAVDEHEEIGAGTHGRAVINPDKFKDRIAAKIKK